MLGWKSNKKKGPVTICDRPSSELLNYGALTSLILVPQFASAVRVFPQRKLLVLYSDSVHVCPMYSEAIHTLDPTGTAAP